MDIMTVSRNHRDMCDGYYDNHIQGTNTVFPVNPSSTPRDVWCDEEESYSELKEIEDEKSKKTDKGIQGKNERPYFCYESAVSLFFVI